MSHLIALLGSAMAASVPTVILNFSCHLFSGLSDLHACSRIKIFFPLSLSSALPHLHLSFLPVLPKVASSSACLALRWCQLVDESTQGALHSPELEALFLLYMVCRNTVLTSVTL